MRWLVVLAIGCSRPQLHSHRAHARLPALAPVAIREVALARAPGALPSGVILEPGFPLPAEVASWLHVRIEHPLWIDGWVPASARGPFWREQHVGVPDLESLDADLVVRESPDPDAPIDAVLDRGTSAAIHGVPGTWAPVEAFAARVHVTGWAIVPPPRGHTFDFDGDVIEGDLVHPEGERD